MNAKLLDAETDVNSLIDQLDSRDPTQREHAREALIDVGREAVVPVLQRLQQGSQRSTWEAAKVLGAVADPAAASALVELLDHDNHDIRWVAAESLTALGRDGLKQVLMALLSKADSIGVQKSAHHVVAHFAKQRAFDFLHRLLPAFDAFEPAVALPNAAFHALHELKRLNL
jgi:HEAT repeat protein